MVHKSGRDCFCTFRKRGLGQIREPISVCELATVSGLHDGPSPVRTLGMDLLRDPTSTQRTGKPINSCTESGIRYEWDEAKNRSNFAKNGLRFEDAEQVFSGPCVTFVDGRFD